MAETIGSLAGTGVSLSVLMALVVANIGFPPSVIATTVVSIIGGGPGIVNAVYAAVNAEEKFQDVNDYYAVITAHGKKL